MIETYQTFKFKVHIAMMNVDTEFTEVLDVSSMNIR